VDLFARDDDGVAMQILDDIAHIIELGDRVKQAAKQIRRGELAYDLGCDFDTVSFHIMCDFAEAILEQLAPALEMGCSW